MIQAVGILTSKEAAAYSRGAIRRGPPQMSHLAELALTDEHGKWLC